MEILITQQQIQSRVAELARQIEADYTGRPLSLIGVMTGSLMLLADLARSIQIPSRVGVIQAGSYRGATTVSGALLINHSFLPDVAGRDVIILDDILDTGHTLASLRDLISKLGPNSITTGVLLRKIGRQIIPIEPDYTGFEIPNRFVIGYGLDYNDDYRHLPHIGVLDEPPEEEFAHN
ncbi:MAG: hypoxanthine phosphoribosyltransferase [Planctomycetota bacterium]|nr:hypoxanthine phosphoribosyltransferase [Planctomycetota bacterium]